MKTRETILLSLVLAIAGSSAAVFTSVLADNSKPSYAWLAVEGDDSLWVATIHRGVAADSATLDRAAAPVGYDLPVVTKLGEEAVLDGLISRRGFLDSLSADRVRLSQFGWPLRAVFFVEHGSETKIWVRWGSALMDVGAFFLASLMLIATLGFAANRRRKRGPSRAPARRA